MRPRDRRTTEDRLERLLEVDPVAMGTWVRAGPKVREDWVRWAARPARRRERDRRTAQAAAWAGTTPTLSDRKHGLGAELFDLIADLLFIGV